MCDTSSCWDTVMKKTDEVTVIMKLVAQWGQTENKQETIKDQ